MPTVRATCQRVDEGFGGRKAEGRTERGNTSNKYEKEERTKLRLTRVCCKSEITSAETGFGGMFPTCRTRNSHVNFSPKRTKRFAANQCENNQGILT